MNPAEEYILEQLEPFRSILLQVQVVIESTIPEVELKFKYKIPFYYIDGAPFCYLNVPKNKKYVDVGVEILKDAYTVRDKKFYK